MQKALCSNRLTSSCITALFYSWGCIDQQIADMCAFGPETVRTARLMISCALCVWSSSPAMPLLPSPNDEARLLPLLLLLASREVPLMLPLLAGEGLPSASTSVCNRHALHRGHDSCWLARPPSKCSEQGNYVVVQT